MPSFLYFADSYLNPISADAIDGFGLRYAFENAATHGPLTTHTPSGNPGTIFADCQRLGGDDLSYRPDEQVWRKLPATGAGPQIYVGCWRDRKPTPADLERRAQVPGEFVRLADGAEWLVPRLRFFAGENGFETALPTLIDVDDAGNLVVAGVADEHAGLERLGQRLIEGMFAGELELAPRLTVKEAVESVAQLLAVNYVVSTVELGKQLLGALANNDTLMAACRAAVDYKTAASWAEKKSARGAAG